MKTLLSLTRPLACGAALLLGACMTNDEPGENFANAKVDAKTAAQSLAGGFSAAGDWGASTAAPAGMQSLSGISTQVGGLKQKAVLYKRMASDTPGVEIKIDLDDTAKGYYTVMATYIGIFETTYDTAVAKWDDKAKDTVKDNENIITFKRRVVHAGGKVKTAEFTDEDGNGQVTPVPGIDNRAKLVLSVYQFGYTETTVLKVSAGPDDNFDLEADNRILEASWTKKKGAAVIGQGAYLDGDGDGVVLDNAKDCIVIAKYFDLEPAGKPLTKRISAEAKVRVFANKAGDEPISFAFEEELLTGRTNSLTLKNAHGGTDIIKGDTLTVILETTVTAKDDTLKHARIEFVMNPGQDLKSDLDDSLYAFHIYSEKKLGFEREAEFHFYSDKPVPHGGKAESGHFDGKATYANGKSATLTGTFSPTKFVAEYTGPEGNSVKIEISLDGKIIAGI